MDVSKKTMLFLAVSFLLILFGCGLDTSTPSGHILSWLMPTTYSDGSTASSSDIKGYNIYYGTSLDGMELAVFVPSPATDLDVAGLHLSAGNYYFAVTAVDLSGTESDLSNTVNMRI